MHVVTRRRPWLEGKVAADVRWHQGAPTVFVNGRPFHFGSIKWGPYDGGLPSLRQANPDAVFLYESVEVGDDDDFSRLDSRFDTIFTAQPRAFGGLHLGLNPSRRWALSHTEDMPGFEEPVDWSRADTFTRWDWVAASFASEAFRHDACALLERLVRHLDERYNGRVIAYQVGAGIAWENEYLWQLDGQISGGDFSPVMMAHFRQRLREYYDGSVEKLRAAWSDPQVTFETARAPARMELLQSEWFCLRSPRRSRTADFFRAQSEALEDCILAWAEAVKRGSGGSALFASPCGSVLDTGIHTYMLLHNRKACFRRILESAAVHLLESPASYILRHLGRGDTSAMIPLGSVRLHGKLWLRDFDSRTSIAASNQEPGHEDGPVSSLWRAPRDAWEDVQMLKRDAGYSLIKGGAYWLHEIDRQGQMFSLPEHIAAVKRLLAIGRAALHAGRDTAPGMAVFVDPASNLRQSTTNRLIYLMNYEARQLQWAHAGMAQEIYCVDDAAHHDMPAHKLLMVTNAFCLTDAQARGLLALARRNRATVIWLMAPGVQTAAGFDLDRVSALVGVRVRSADVEALARVSLLPGEHAWSRPPLPGGGTLDGFGAGPHDWDGQGGYTVGPLFYADVSGTPDAVVLGMLDMLREPGLVVRRMDGYTSVYCAAPYVHRALLRQIGRDSGAHVYTDGDDLVYASPNLFMINARGDGARTIRWPQEAAVVFDLYTGRTVGKQLRQWAVRMRRNETRLFFAGPAAMATAVRSALRS